jgi:predicted transcriptional regulator
MAKTALVPAAPVLPGTDPILPLATQIVVAYLKQNPVPQAQVPQVIQVVVRALGALGGGRGTASAAALPTPDREPAVPIKRSVTDAYIVCLEDGRKLRMLKRHLRTAYNMSPDQYRRKWNLPPDYPMVAPAYARARSAYAKEAGLGRRGKKPARGRGRSTG